MGPTLFVGDPKQTGRALRLKAGRNVIGRDVAADIVLSGSSVSRFHTAITIDDEGMYVEDLNSANGTLVNDEPIKERRKISFGDHLVVGDVQLQLNQLPLEPATLR
jgi:pSer/pThr/pTyr-binding forkhead associated (FHA) protein